MSEKDFVERIELRFPSADKKSTVRAVVWAPLFMKKDEEAQRFRPLATVQLIHGMAEHIDRYDDFARFLASLGYLVAGHDHIGHGRTAPTAELRGVIDAALGARAMMADVEILRQILALQVTEDTPAFAFGHSMGSLVLRSYLPARGRMLRGAVVCGTAHEPPLVSAAGNLLARFIALGLGNAYKSPLLHYLADGAYGRAIPHARTPFDWLSRDPAVPDEFMADEACGFMFGAGAYAALTELAYRAASRATAAATPRQLPLLFVAGEGDPVGAFGKGVARAARAMEQAGSQDVTLRLFPAMRHEILNEIGHEEVYEYVARWIEERR